MIDDCGNVLSIRNPAVENVPDVHSQDRYQIKFKAFPEQFSLVFFSLTSHPGVRESLTKLCDDNKKY